MQQGLFIMKLEKKIVLGVTSASHLAVHAQMMFFPTLLMVFHKEFGLGMDHLGLMVTVGAFMFGLGAIPTGFLENKFGGKKLLLIYQGGSVVSCILLAFATSPFQLTIGLAILGLASSIYHPAGLTILSRRLEKLSKGLAIHGIAGSLGLALGPFFAAFLTEFGSWRYSYGMWAMIQFILMLITIIFIGQRQEGNIRSNQSDSQLIDKPALVLYYIMAICMGFAFGGFTTFMPTLFGSQTSGIFQYLPATLKAGFFTTLVFGIGIAGQTFGGLLGDKYDRTSLLFWIILFNIPLLFFIGFTKGWSLFIFSILLGITYFSNQPISNALLADLTPSARRGLGYGISFFLGFGIGGLAPAVCGFITEQYNLELVFPVMSLSLIPGLVAVWLLQKRTNQTA